MVAAAAILARAGLLIYAERQPARFDFPDSHRYVQVAQNIAAGLGPVESSEVQAGTDPLYPYVLSLETRFGFDDAPALLRFGRIVNCLCGVASVLVLGLFARHFFGDRPALIAAAMLAVDPILLFFNGLVLTEIPYTLLLLGAWWAVAAMSDSVRGVPRVSTTTTPVLRSYGWALAAGLFVGLATATRSSNLLMPLLLAPFVWWFSGGRLVRRAASVLVFLVFAAATLAPTAVRNYRLLGYLVPVRTGGGASLLEALAPWADGGPGMDRIQYPAFPPGADEYQRDRLCRQQAVSWAWENPGTTVRLAWAKLKRTWSISLNAAGYSSATYTAITWLTVAPEFALAIVGLWMLRRRPVVLGLLLAPAVYLTLLHMIFVGSVRYRVPAMPFLFVAAAVAMDAVWSGHRHPSPDPVGSAS
jgi:4-amino-4-deoxy-L-arabinose transferase-like glycosyltransferase